MDEALVFEDPESADFSWTEFEAKVEAADGDDVISGLRGAPKSLPPKYFYDDVGSALFEQITDLPEYYPTRTEEAILAAAAAEIVERTGTCEVIELGSGSARKTRVLIEAYWSVGRGDAPALRYLPVDVSGQILKDSSRDLIDAFPGLQVWGLIGTYEQALTNLPPRQLDSRMVLFLGSTVGNLTPAETVAFLSKTASALKTGEYFLIGFDLQKDIAVLEAAYNDSQGVTAAFNLNMLTHLNWRFDGDFDVEQFAHHAFYNQNAHQIEMHLVSGAAQEANLNALDLSVPFATAETIHTEISRKFTVDHMTQVFHGCGFDPVTHWCDPQNWFALALYRKR
jgi:L-histidine N-alpha-methyltransferase